MNLKEFRSEVRNRKRFEFFSDFRASNKLSFGIGSQTINTKDDVGYIERNSEKIFFGRRDVKSFENNFELLYNLNTKSAISLKARNFWSTANYDKILFELLEDGNRKIVDYSNLKKDPNTNTNNARTANHDKKTTTTTTTTTQATTTQATTTRRRTTIIRSFKKTKRITQNNTK